MSRSARLEYAGACYHVINRGNYRRDLFGGQGAAAAFERVLDETCTRFGWRVHAYVIMSTHFHLALETTEPNLSVGMKWLQGTWVSRFNRLRRITGRPFQGRFKALHVERGHALAQVAHYIHLNPVRARIVIADELAGFRWSSLYHFPRKNRADWLEAGIVLAESGGLSDTKAGWKRYLAYLALMAEEDPAERDRRFGKLSRGWCVGSPEFRAELRKNLTDCQGRDRQRFAGIEPDEWQRERETAWAEYLQASAAALGINLNALPPKKSAPEKVQLAAILKHMSDVSNGWLARRLKMGEPGSVSQFVHRFRLAGGTETPAFQAVLSRVET